VAKDRGRAAVIARMRDIEGEPLLTDEQLVVKLKRGDRSAGDALMVRHQRLVARAVCEVIHDLAAVQDLIQEAFLKAFRKIHLYDPNMGRFTLWLTTIARHETVNHLRKLKRSRLVLTEELAPLEEPSPTDRPSQTISKRETWTRVIQIIRGFREPDRTILTKRILESKPFNDIARLLGQPVDTVKSIYYRTTAELREKAGFAGP